MTKRVRGTARPPTTLWIPSASLDRQLLDYTAIEDRLWDTRLLAWDVFGSLGHVESLRASSCFLPRNTAEFEAAFAPRWEWRMVPCESGPNMRMSTPQSRIG